MKRLWDERQLGFDAQDKEAVRSPAGILVCWTEFHALSREVHLPIVEVIGAGVGVAVAPAAKEQNRRPLRVIGDRCLIAVQESSGHMKSAVADLGGALGVIRVPGETPGQLLRLDGTVSQQPAVGCDAELFAGGV